MPSYSSDRRSLLKIIGAIGATCAYPFASDELFGQTASAANRPLPQQNSPARFFNEDDFATVSRIADLIIPETETPGAVGSGVPAYIDLVISRNTDQQLVMADGLRWLDGEAKRLLNRRFIELPEEQQISILEPLCEAADKNERRARNVQFFALMKSLTADGYYTSKVGLRTELGYTGDMARAGFPDCVHEH
ncbi:MAG TPA: gluconate 2-dehydrogenase subunit 3 family protein [Bryobacteraceae bacterium]|nr:gluconate 2-dehydrogenase subunit 3 family protein [Bryobacteraceae bacterium]